MHPFAVTEPGIHLAEPWALGILFAGIAVFAAVGALSHEKERAFSASLIYLGLGIVAAVATAILGLGWLDPIKDAEPVERATEIAMLVALFSAGLKLERTLSWRAWGSVVRLLLIAMPLTILAVVAFGTGVLGLSLGAAIVLGAALAPTDPVLAGDIGVGPPGDEDEHEPNFALTAEAGFNDGLAGPFVFLGLLVAESKLDATTFILEDVIYALGVGLALGAALGWLLASSVVRLRDRDLLTASLDGWLALAAVLLIYGVAETLSTNGFIAVFVGGLAFRRYERDHEINGRVHHGAEIIEKFGELAVILLLGSMLSFDGLGTPGIAGWGLALLLVFIIRPLAVNIGLFGSKMERPGERAYVAWFGVRGVGTLFYVTSAVASGILTPAEESLIVWTAIASIIVSIVVHGVTASPLRSFLERVLHADDEPGPERGREGEPVPA